MDDRAAARLAALARHIGAATNGEWRERGLVWGTRSVEGETAPTLFPPLSGARLSQVPVPTAATATRPIAGGGPGTLTLVDSRTGKRYEVPIREGGVIRATDLKQIKAGGDGMGLRTYDPG